MMKLFIPLHHRHRHRPPPHLMLHPRWVVKRFGNTKDAKLSTRNEMETD